MSEPGAGSDLATLRARADRVSGADGDGDHFLVNGQMVWTYGAHDADVALILPPYRPRCAEAPRRRCPRRTSSAR